jgi:two-component system chemotaxis response regulator CheB
VSKRLASTCARRVINLTKRHTPASWFVAIGASGAEGLCDIQALLAALQPSLNATVLVVLHRPWDQLSRLQAVLAPAASMPVAIAADGGQLASGVVYIGEPADHLTLVSRSFGELVHDPAMLHRNRTVDLLFHSVAKHGGKRIVGVVLSGSLDDGARGLASINAAGGLSMVLTPSSQGRAGMPEHAISYDGPIDVIGCTRDIAAAINSAVSARPVATTV